MPAGLVREFTALCLAWQFRCDVPRFLGTLPTLGAAAFGGIVAFSDGIERLLTEAAALAPLLLVVDDLQWADPDSLRVLRYLAVQLREPRIAIVATVPDDEETSSLAVVRATLDRQPGTQHLALVPLADEAVAAIVYALTGAPPDADQLLGDLLDLLDPAVATTVLTEEGGARFAFAHGLVRDALLAELAPAQRRRLHARVAIALGTRPTPVTGGSPSSPTTSSRPVPPGTSRPPSTPQPGRVKRPWPASPTTTPPGGPLGR